MSMPAPPDRNPAPDRPIYVGEVRVNCDTCIRSAVVDYFGATRDMEHVSAVARAHAAAAMGWSHRDGLDYCPDCGGAA